MKNASVVLISFKSCDRIENNWSPLTDQVRGGKSKMTMEIRDDLTAGFFGELWLNDQNAGFASYRVRKEDGTFWNLQNFSGLNIRSRGDGRTYKLLIKDVAANTPNSDYSWQAEIPTTHDFHTTEIKISDLKPIYRGREMEIVKPLDTARIVEIGFQINDKKEGPFEFILKSVEAF